MNTCWFCDRPIEDPPEIIGQWRATRAYVAHKDCLRLAGEIDLALEAVEVQDRGPGFPHEEPGPR
jgi:hypothetical protein